MSLLTNYPLVHSFTCSYSFVFVPYFRPRFVFVQSFVFYIAPLVQQLYRSIILSSSRTNLIYSIRLYHLFISSFQRCFTFIGFFVSLLGCPIFHYFLIPISLFKVALYLTYLSFSLIFLPIIVLLLFSLQDSSIFLFCSFEPLRAALSLSKPPEYYIYIVIYLVG